MVYNRIPVFVRLVFPLIAGILCFADCGKFYWFYLLAGMGFLTILSLFWISYNYSSIGSRRYKHIIFIFLHLLPFLTGSIRSLLNHHLFNDNHFSKHRSEFLLIEVIDEPRIKENRIHIRAAVRQGVKSSSRINLSGNLLITIALNKNLSAQNPLMKLQYGDQLIIPATYNDIAEPRNPFELNVRQWYARQNYFQQTYLPAEQVLIYRKRMGNEVIRWSLALRRKQVERFRKLLTDDEANAVASTLILGYRADLSEDTLRSYSKTGTIHALSVSGMHVGLIYIVIQFLLKFLDRWPAGKVLQLLIAVTLIWLYTLVSGLSPSVLRSAIMLTIYISGKTFSKHLNSVNLLCFAAFIMLLYDPNLIYDVGFQLSYLSVFGLVCLQPLIYNWVHFDNVVLDKFWNFLALSCAAQLVTFPFALYYFHQFPFYFLISNLFITLPVSLIMYVGLAILLLRLEVLGSPFEWLIAFTNAGLKWISELPYATVEGVWITQVELILLCLGLACGCYAFVKFKKAMLLLCLCACFMLAFSFNWRNLKNAKQQRMIVFSLRKNFAIAVLFHEKAWIFTDLKATDKAFRNFVKPALDHSGVRQVTLLGNHQAVHSKVLTFDEHQIRFLNYRVLMVDACFNNQMPGNTLQVDLINLGQHTKADLSTILQSVKTEQLIADGSNSAYHLKQFKIVAHNFKIPLYDLRIKKAYLINVIK